MAVDLDDVRKLCELMVRANKDDHFHALGIEVTDIERKKVTMRLDYNEDLIGNPETGVIHGGAITALLDSCCGFAASTALEQLGLTPTIDLRIDYMGPAEPNKPIYGVGEVYRTTKHVIFTRGIAHQGDPERPIAQAVGNFVSMEPGTFDDFREFILQSYDQMMERGK
ncbi:MAG: PaaI family thioesterase [Cellvibrionaceae bacterium]